MTEEIQVHEGGEGPKKRKIGHKKGKKGNKKAKVFQGSGEKVKIDRKMKKIIRKRVRDYNSDEEEEEEEDKELAPAKNYKREKPHGHDQHELDDGKFSDDDDYADQRNSREDIEASDDEDGEIQPGITKLTEGCNAFRMTFKKITKTSVSDDVLGPVLSAHKKLVAEKLAEEEEERKVNAKKEKHQVGEKGHVKPLNFLDVHEKFLIGVATKGVVKLFNAVNKAQSAQKGLNPSRSKDAKELQKRRKQAFFTELGKVPSGAQVNTGENEEGPSWAPLRDNYMLTNPKMDWDKIAQMTSPDQRIVHLTKNKFLNIGKAQDHNSYHNFFRLCKIQSSGPLR